MIIKVLRNIIGVLLGFVSIIATVLILSLFSIAFFADLVTEDAPVTILMTSTAPLLYSLGSLVLALMSGIFVAARIAKNVSLRNAVIITVAYGCYTHFVSLSSRELLDIYPNWYVTATYLLLLPTALLGHWLVKKLSE